MFPLRNKSLLNEKIVAFYQKSDGKDLDADNILRCFKENGAFNSDQIVKTLFHHQANICDIFGALDSFKYDDYIKCYGALLPIFVHTEDVIHTLRKKYYSLKLEWMGVNIKLYLETFRESNDVQDITKTLEHVLLLTSLLENALVNVYYTETKGKQAPHLLKDLINTQEIRNIFGPELVIILKIVMGTPNSINIRNITWHGFPKPFEIPVYYETVLLVLIHTLGCTITSMNYHIIERPLVVEFITPVKGIANELKMEIDNINYFEQKIKDIDNNFANDYKAYWLKLCSYYVSKQYVEFMILILPQIELLLRLHYGKINDVDVNAKLDEYYITMDSIFETEITIAGPYGEACQRINRFLDFARYPCYEGCCHLMYDIFLSPIGCRLRDKVSHGEVQLEALKNPQLASVVFHIFLNLLQPLNCHTLNAYESKFHLNCINKEKLLETHNKFQQFNEEFLENSTDSMSSIFFKTTIPKVLIFHRPKKESELMLLINKILENINQTLDNYKESIAIRSTLKAQRELHSKRRKTLEKVQNSLPEIFSTLLLMWSSLNKLYFLLQNNYVAVLEDGGKCLKTIRFLKHTLTISENFVKYSHCDSNEWIKSLELCRKFQEIRNKLFFYTDC